MMRLNVLKVAIIQTPTERSMERSDEQWCSIQAAAGNAKRLFITICAGNSSVLNQRCRHLHTGSDQRISAARLAQQMIGVGNEQTT